MMVYRNLELCLFRKRRVGVMNWKEELEQLERDKNWKAAIDLMNEVIGEHSDDVEAYVRAIYLSLEYPT